MNGALHSLTHGKVVFVDFRHTVLVKFKISLILQSKNFPIFQVYVILTIYTEVQSFIMSRLYWTAGELKDNKTKSQNNICFAQVICSASY